MTRGRYRENEHNELNFIKICKHQTKQSKVEKLLLKLNMTCLLGGYEVILKQSFSTLKFEIQGVK